MTDDADSFPTTRPDGRIRSTIGPTLPDVLDPDRIALLYGAGGHGETSMTRMRCDLDEAVSYGAALFTQLATVQRYLVDDIARNGLPVPLLDDELPSSSKLDTRADWMRWIQVYTDVGRLLAGPSGDAGHASSVARAEYRAHQTGSPRRP